ncbi:NAD(P)-dependent oxidoreductase [Porticoccaceae bacterium]|nr:NAD(P)-dependent oxidoreductase [Porticoccaceae bacterium]
MNKILVVGKNSFVAQHFIAASEIYGLILDICSHNDMPDDLSEYGWIINFSINPKMFSEHYSTSFDQDYLISHKIIGNTQARFVMISSRTVYPCDDSTVPLIESSAVEISNQSQYGLNKIQSEGEVRATLAADKLLILRASNIFGLEVGRHTFMGVAQRRLIEKNEILLDINGATIRDFIPVDFFCEYLVRLVKHNASGIYNVGSGEGITVHEICSEIISGFGEGEIKTLAESIVKQQFILDITKLEQLTGYKISKAKIFSYTRKLGEQLSKEKNRDE